MKPAAIAYLLLGAGAAFASGITLNDESSKEGSVFKWTIRSRDDDPGKTWTTGTNSTQLDDVVALNFGLDVTFAYRFESEDDGFSLRLIDADSKDKSATILGLDFTQDTKSKSWFNDVISLRGPGDGSGSLGYDLIAAFHDRRRRLAEHHQSQWVRRRERCSP